MQVFVLLIFVLVIVVIALAIYVTRLRRAIRESDNPLLALTRRQRAEHAIKLLEHEQGEREVELQNRWNEAITGKAPYRQDR